MFERDEISTAAGGGYNVFTPYKTAWLKALKPEHMAPGRSARARPASPGASRSR